MERKKKLSVNSRDNYSYIEHPTKPALKDDILSSQEDAAGNPTPIVLDHGSDSILRGFIYSEILGPPLCKRRR
jgi:hypothetical protein